MAANRVGKIFVELDLDKSRYMRSQQTLLKDASKVTLDIENNFRKLGTKSDAVFDLMRAKAENAYQGIKHSGKATADDLIRAERTKAAQILRINEQQYGVQLSMMEKFKKNWIGITATMTAGFLAARKAWDMAEVAAQFEQSQAAFKTMVQSMGMNAETEFNKIKAASANLIDKKSLIEASNRAMSLGIPLNKIADLMEIARAKARDMGITTTQAFNDIATGVGRASPLILDNLGLVMKVGAANEAMAASLGKTVAELTDQEKKTAVLNATLNAGKEALDRYNMSIKTTSEKMQGMKATLEDTKLLLGQITIRAGIALKGVADWATTLVASITFIFAKASQGFYGLLSKIPKFGEAYKGIYEEAKKIADANDAIIKGSASAGLEALRLAIASSDDLLTITKKTTPAIQESTAALKDNSTEMKQAAKDAEHLAKALENIAIAVEKARWDKAAKDMAQYHDVAIETMQALQGLELEDDAEQAKIFTDVMDDLNKSLEEQADLFDYTVFGDGANQNVQNLMKSLDKLLDVYDDIAKAQKEQAKRLEEINKLEEGDKKAKAMEAYYKTEKKLALESTQAQIGAYGQLFGALKGMFEENTAMYKVMYAAEQAMALVKGVQAVLSQGQGDPYSAYARIAAMAGVVATFLSMIGVAFGGGGGGSDFQEEAKSPSTVLGADAGTGSESIVNALDILQEQNDEQLWALYDIYNATKDLNQSILTFVVGVLQGTVGGGGLSGMEYKIPGFSIGSIGNGGSIKGYERGPAPGDPDSAEAFDQWLKDTFAWAMAGFDELSEVVLESLTKVFADIGKTFIDLAIGLGVDVQDVLDYVFPDIHLDLTGLTESEIEDAIINYFSDMTDAMAEALFGDIVGQYQQVGEGMYETAVRVLAEKEAILSALSMTGQAFEGTAEEAVYFTQALIELADSFEALTEDVSDYFEQYLAEAEKMAWLNDNLAAGYEAIGIAMPESRQAFKDLVASLDLTTEYGQQLYVALMDIAGATDAYYDALEAGYQTTLEAKRRLTGTEDQGTVYDINQKYGWDIDSQSRAYEYIQRFIDASTEELQAYADAMGVTVEELVDDIMSLAEVYGWLDDATANATSSISKLAQEIRDNLATIRADLYGTGTGGASSLLSVINAKRDEVSGALAAGDMDTAMGILQIMSQDLGTWYQQARAERIAEETNRLNGEREILNEQLRVAQSFASLVDSIDSVINGIKYSGLNTTLPTPKAAMAKGDYNALKNKALSSGSVEDYQAFTQFANTALTQYQAAYKSSETYQTFYDQVMADLEAARSNAEAQSYDEAILQQLEAIEDALQNIDLSGVIADFEDVAQYIEGMLAQLERTEFLLSVDWSNFEGDMADALGYLAELVGMYGWENVFTLQFISEIPMDLFDDLNDLATAAGWIADQSGGWNSTATVAFLKNVGANYEFDNIEDILHSIGYVKEQAGSWTADATIAFIAGLFDQYGGSLDNIEGWLDRMGISDQTIRSEMEVKLVYKLWADGDVDTEAMADWAYAKLLGSGVAGVDKAYAMVGEVVSLMNMIGNIDNYANVGSLLYQWSPLARSAFGNVSDLQSGVYNAFKHAKYPYTGLAEGGIISSPMHALIGEAGYPEAVIPMKDGVNIPVKWINGGSTGRGDMDTKTINLTVQIAGKEFEGEVKAWADDVVVMRNKRGKGNDTRRYYR